ncbi:hypothetical protein [Salisediminibacterium selenitireducens]|uniref:Uncharacterized protein n=1 Tax=Bacillus selenitireducens (strain ATCC 700615 / DSM 15326 / MLS10) TaxID=439292 RepID=D6XUS8_BACIE|nr:hypothetical protein [Salisediminibacterium selenitireducens]ADH99564.1 hypothetical protein Bsel_2060 [[Bacillus] selenitireducens MLS10]
MVLTEKEKKLLLKLLKREQMKKFALRQNRKDVKQLADKFEQNLRNQKVNETKPSKL